MRALLAGLLLAVGLVVAGPSGTAVACSCARLAPEVHAEGATSVFAGELVHRERGGGIAYDFRVDEVLKGHPGGSTRVWSGASEASCGLTDLTVGSDYLVFTQQAGNGREYVGLCGGTKPLSERAVQRVERVTGPGTAPSAAAPAVTSPGPRGAPDGVPTDRDQPAEPFVPYWAMAVAASGALALLALLLARRRLQVTDRERRREAE